MTFWRWLVFMMVDNAIGMSWHLFPGDQLRYDWANACDHLTKAMWICVLLLSRRFGWKISRLGIALIGIHVLFELLEVFDELTNGNTTVPIIEFIAYFAVVGAVVFAKYRYGDRCG